MSKTLDQYTPEEQQQMIGRWCDYETTEWGTVQGIILTIVPDSGALVILPFLGTAPHCEQRYLAPRLDLLPAWIPDGQPVPMTGQYENVGPDFPDTEDMPDLPDGTLVFRHCTEWEEA